MSLFAELKRRNVLRVGAAYVAVAWLLIQVTETLFPIFGMSDIAIRAVVILLAIGFIPAVVSAWAFELTPEGFVREREVDRGSPIIQRMTRRLDRLIMVALALALGYFAFDKFVLDPARDRVREEEIAQAAKEAGRAEAARSIGNADHPGGPPMVAVLPFVSVGSGKDSAFFAAGVHDDLLTQLAQLESIRVISRTSVLEYRDTERNIREIGEALGADAILEGGVQTVGSRIRINAQLIDASTDEHLWAETYDRELTAANIFDVQTEIARAIAAALQGTLSERDAGSLNLIPTRNMAAYRTYHEALALRDSRHGAIVSPEYRALLRKAADLDPKFTRPLAELVGSLSLPNISEKDPVLMEQAEQILTEIKATRPNSADLLIAQAYYTYYILQDYELAHEIASKALTMRPSDMRLLEMKSWIERRKGDYDAMIESTRLMRSLDPRNPRWTRTIIHNLIFTHQYDEAIAEIDAGGSSDYWILMPRTILRMKEHGNLGRFTQEMEALHEEFDNAAPIVNLWEARIADRNYIGAEALLKSMEAEFAEDSTPTWVLPDRLAYGIITYWFLNQADRVGELVREARSILDENRYADIFDNNGRVALVMALLAAVEGDARKTVQLVRQWNREGAADWPERMFFRNVSCQVLAMAGATAAAVDCIRTGLREPSLVVPFFEPYLPYYDSIRDDPEFVALLEEIGDPSLRLSARR